MHISLCIAKQDIYIELDPNLNATALSCSRLARSPPCRMATLFCLVSLTSIDFVSLRPSFNVLANDDEYELMSFHFSESRAIAKYILRKYKSSEVDLLRESDIDAATMVDVWTEVEAQQYYPALSPVVFECIIFPIMRGTATDQKVVDESLEELKKVLVVYEAHLSKHKYLAGDSFSFADLNHFPFTFYFMATPYASVFDAYPRVKAWWQRLISRPSIKKISASMPTKF